MANITFAQLTDLYRHASFAEADDEATLSIDTPALLALIKDIEKDDQAAKDAGINVLVDESQLSLGQKVPIHIGAPKIGLGFLVEDFEKLLHTHGAMIAEPNAYYIISDGTDRTTVPPPEILVNYRKILDLISLFAEASSYLDKTKQEFILIRDGKFAIPVHYGAKILENLAIGDVQKLLDLFKDDVHKEQKLPILAEALAHICGSQPDSRRFQYIIENIKAVTDEVGNGYRLFISSFSYAKIRSELEAEKVEYISKIHKTLVDIQGQLLGIPVATVIVASQLKVAHTCGVDSWTNLAVLSGAWVFLGLLIISIVNQWITLSSIAGEIDYQKQKLVSDYAAISDKFIDIFNGLSGRIRWSRKVLIVIGAVASAGAMLSTFAYHRLNSVSLTTCLSADPDPNAISTTLSGAISEQKALPNNFAVPSAVQTKAPAAAASINRPRTLPSSQQPTKPSPTEVEPHSK
jgi:hypothetical protein